MTQQDETVKHWIKVFGSLNSPKPEIFNPSNEAIQDKLDNDPVFLLDICTKILMLKDCEDESIMIAKSLSAILLSQLLNIQNNLEQLRQNFLPDSELIKQIKDSLKQNIFSTNPTIRNKCAQTYAFLLAILLSNWQDGIDDIIKLFTNTSLLPYGFIGLISIMQEIVNLIQYVNELLQFEDQFAQTIVFCISILSKDQSDERYIPELRTEACRFIHDTVYWHKEIFDDEGKKGAKIPALLENIGNSFKVKDLDLFQMLHQLLFMIVKEFYPQSPEFMELISSYVGNGFELISTNPDFVNISIYFWKEVASLEDKIITKYDIDEKLCRPISVEKLDPLLTQTASDKLIPILLNFMECINEEDKDVEDIHSSPEPSMYSTITVAAFYKLAPQVIFEKVKEKAESVIAKADNWTHIHAVIHMIYSIADEPTNDIVGQYISEKFDLLLEATLPHQVPRLRETALFVIGLAIKNYPQIITRVGDAADKRITEIINSIEPSLNISEQQQSGIPDGTLQIFKRYCSIIFLLSSAWQNNLYESRLPSYFEKFYEIIEKLFKYAINSNDQMLIRNSSEALNQLIFNATPDLTIRLGEIYKNTLDYLEQSRSQNLPSEIIYMVQSSYCANISTLLLKFKKNSKPNGFEIIFTYAGRTLEILYELLSKDSDVYEEGLMAISALVNATYIKEEDAYIEIFNQDNFTRLIDEFIYNGLKIMDPGVINACCLLIGNLYYFQLEKIPELINVVPDLFHALSNIILEHKEMRVVHPFILKAIADIFNCLDQFKGPIPDLESELKDLLVRIYDMSSELDITNKNDVEYGNLFYQYLTDAFCGYAVVYYNKEDLAKEREQLFLFDKLANYIYKLSPRISEGVYVSFAKAAHQFSINCSRRNNVILNRHSVHRILKQGLENVQYADAKKKIKEQIEFLKSK